MKTRLMAQPIPVLRTLRVAASLLALGGCASGPDIRADFDPSTNFAQYKTFAFVHPLGTDRDGYQSIVSQRLKAATQREMEARGMRLEAGHPQLLVNFNATLTEKMRVSPVPTVMVGVGAGDYFGYGMGMYGMWPLYYDPSAGTTYQEGTLNIDVVDAARKQQVWEGVVTDIVTQKMLDNLQATIDAAVAAAFSKYPVAAPVPAPAAK